jgi:hypothetical protein
MPIGPETIGVDPGTGSTGTGVTLQGSVTGPVGMIVKITFDGQEAGETDVTTSNNAIANQKYRTFIPTLLDAKGANLDLLYERENMALILSRLAQPNEAWTITFPDGSTFVTQGHIKKLGTAIPDDDKITQTLTLRFSGKPSFNSASGSF